MLIDFGSTLLELAILTSLAQFLLMFMRKTNYQPSLAICSAVLLLLAFATLSYGFATSDFSLELVVLHSHTQKPLLYKITATWGNHEGSMLLWCLILSLYSAYMAVKLQMLPSQRTVVLAVMGLMQLLFVLYLRIASNPFAEMLPPAFEGQGFNPLLQDFGLAIHPPILYAGYVGFAAPFAIAVAVLWRGGDAGFAHLNFAPTNFAKVMHPYIMFPWAMLTAGIALGSWWAYRELGWGGWWFWDPVENVALLPWLCATALFHANLVLRKSGNMPRYVLLLAISCFALSLVGTFLVRSGLLTSVHSFASDPTRGLAICAIMAIIVSVGIAAYLKGAGRLPYAAPCKLLSKETLILVNNLLLLLATAMILLATFYPFVVEAISDKRITIGADYFTQIFAYLMLPLVLACACSNFLAWSEAPTGIKSEAPTEIKSEAPTGIKRKKGIIACVETAIITGLLVWLLGNASVMLVLGMFCGVALLLVTTKITASRLYRRNLTRRQVPMLLGHAGLGLFVLCATAFGAYHQSAEFVMQKGEVRTAFGEYQITLHDVEFGAGANYLWQRGNVQIMQGNVELQFTPEERYYEVEGQFTTEATIKHFFNHDLYVTMKRISNSEKDNVELSQQYMPQQYMIYIYYNPAMSFLWLSVAMIAIAGIVAAINVAPTMLHNKQQFEHEATLTQPKQNI